MTPVEYIKRLTECSCKKLKLTEEMLTLTVAQSQSINEDELEGMEKLVLEKQVKIDAINVLDEEFDVYFLRIKRELGVSNLNELDGLNLPGAKELSEIIAKIMDVIKKISEIEENNNKKAKELLNKFSDNIKKIKQGRKTNTAYMPEPIAQPSYYIDKKK